MNDKLGEHCPSCGDGFEIVFVKFRLSGVQAVIVCPNCARASIWKTEPDAPHQHRWQFLNPAAAWGKAPNLRGLPEL